MKWRKRLGLTLLALFSPFFLVLATVPFWGHAWQLVKGNSVVVAGWKIRIPPGFYATFDGGRPKHLWRLSLGAPLLKRSYNNITLFLRDTVLSEDKFYRDLEAGFVEPAQSEGFAFVRERQFAVGVATARCFEFERKEERPDYAVRCAVNQSAVWPWYEGGREYVGDFYAMVEGMKREP